MMPPRRNCFSFCLVSLVLVLSGCSASDTADEVPQSLGTQAVVQSTVVVEKRGIVPTLSTKTSVVQAASFVVSTSQQGLYRSAVKVGQSVTAGQVLGWNNGAELHSPVDAVVKSVSTAVQELPAHYPVFELEYQGFAFEMDASSLLATAPLESLSGKFQISEGVGPTDVKAVVAAPGDQVSHDISSSGSPSDAGGSGNASPVVFRQNATPQSGGDAEGATSSEAGIGGGEAEAGTGTENGVETNSHVGVGADGVPDQSQEQPGGQLQDKSQSQESSGVQAEPRVASSRVLCLIDKSVAVYPGQSGTVVLRGQAKDNVLALPVSAVAGRLQKGSVTLVQGGRGSAVDVGLGVSDGAYIEITSGLKQGDTVSSLAPYLDPRNK